MAFEFAYSLDGLLSSNIQNFAKDADGTAGSGYNTGNTLASPNATAYNAKKGDLVFLNTNGMIRKSIQAASNKATGVVEGFEFTGLVGQGQPYAAGNVSNIASATDTTNYPNGVVKVRIESDSVYRVPVKSGQTVALANVGNYYGIYIDPTTGDQKVDLTATTNTLVKVVGVNTQSNKLYVILSNNNTF